MTILLTGLCTRPLAESAAAAGRGAEVVTVDYFGDLDQRTWVRNRSLLRDLGLPYRIDALVGACAGVRADAVVYVANLENHPRAVAALARGRRLLGNPPDTLRRVRDPRVLFPCLARAGVRVPRTIGTPGRRPGPLPSLIKPLGSGGGRGVRFQPLDRPLRRGAILQEYIAGRPCGTPFLANGREAFALGVAEQLVGEPALGAGGFRYCGSLLMPPDPAILRQIDRILAAIVPAFGLVGLNGLDFILRDGEVIPLEVNPRYPASAEVFDRAFGINAYAAHLDACGGRLPAWDPWTARPVSWMAKGILFAHRPVVMPDTTGWIARGIRDVPHPGELIGRGQPICTLFAEGETHDACRAVLFEKAEALREELTVALALRGEKSSPS